MHCLWCGAEIAADADRCPRCGRDVRPVGPAAPAGPRLPTALPDFLPPEGEAAEVAAPSAPPEPPSVPLEPPSAPPEPTPGTGEPQPMPEEPDWTAPIGPKVEPGALWGPTPIGAAPVTAAESLAGWDPPVTPVEAAGMVPMDFPEPAEPAPRRPHSLREELLATTSLSGPDLPEKSRLTLRLVLIAAVVVLAASALAAYLLIR
ncbi:MAG TPA: hypothetical protein VG245_01570 [Candidatus Dormibacteraeota bacterium]|nr:hypothetical protein [Candidatus Dormibacteraeota bacterium]